jgi:hypothetical protein
VAERMTITGADRPEVGKGNWRQVSGLPGIDVFTRLDQDHNGRIVVREVVVRSDERVASEQLQRIPLSSIERMVAGYVEHRAAEDLARELEPLERREDDTPESFASKVAYQYDIYAAVSRKPAVMMAAKAKVPVSRVHRWIREARRLGKLPPGRQGAPG